MRARTLCLPALFAAAVAAGCGRNPADMRFVNPPTSPDTPDADVGSLLYAAKPPVKMALPPLTGREPIAVPNCTVQFEERQQVSAEVDGTIEVLAVRDDTIQPGDVNLIYHPRDLMTVNKVQVPGQAEPAYNPQELAKLVKFRRLREGDTVKNQQVICFLDDQLVVTKMEAAVESKAAATEVKTSAKDGLKYT
ncbi:MAG TPA: hypothetical protein VH092_36935, partial [Urbifossiella sp.]|nr:hypothetical protein [Urbifossiella sp.]